MPEDEEELLRPLSDFDFFLRSFRGGDEELLFCPLLDLLRRRDFPEEEALRDDDEELLRDDRPDWLRLRPLAPLLEPDDERPFELLREEDDDDRPRLEAPLFDVAEDDRLRPLELLRDEERPFELLRDLFALRLVDLLDVPFPERDDDAERPLELLRDDRPD